MWLLNNCNLKVTYQCVTLFFPDIYGGFARSCIAKTSQVATNEETEYQVTDADGCATDPSIFGEWERSEDGSVLRVAFNAFKFPSSDNIRFQCNIRVCFGKCQPVRFFLCMCRPFKILYELVLRLARSK